MLEADCSATGINCSIVFPETAIARGPPTQPVRQVAFPGEGVHQTGNASPFPCTNVGELSSLVHQALSKQRSIRWASPISRAPSAWLQPSGTGSSETLPSLVLPWSLQTGTASIT